MWDSSRYLCSLEQFRANSLGSSNRKQSKNHTSKFRELALLLPVALKTGSKKLTKKEILLHVLHYIQYLQRSIDEVKALLKFHTTDGEGGFGGLGWNPAMGPARQRHSTPPSSPHSHKSCLQGACRKPRKKKLTRASERRTRAQNPRRCLAPEKPRKQMALSLDQEGRNMGGTTTPPGCSCIQHKAASSPPQDDRKGGSSWLTLLEMAENIIHCDISSCFCKKNAQEDRTYPAFKAQRGTERIHFFNRTQLFPRQKLVFYDSNEEVYRKSPDADPWLTARTPEGSPHGSPLASGPPQMDKWSVPDCPSTSLGLSPSLFSSPGKLLPEKILEDGTQFLTQALFEEVFLDPVSSPSSCMLEVPQKKDTPTEASKDHSDPHSLSQFPVSQDHSYLSPSENKGSSSPSSEDSDIDTYTELVWKPQEDAQVNPEDSQPSSEEDRDYTWTPTRLSSTKKKKGQAGRCPVKSKKKIALCPIQMKKKCVNGFIMFCRMNRKQYIRSCPGTASTAATKELAQLWRTMTEQERKPYCIKARRFSRQHNRIVKQESSSTEDEDWGTPKPFYQLLAEKARRASQQASQLPPRCK